jgi:hypothetical protein
MLLLKYIVTLAAAVAVMLAILAVHAAPDSPVFCGTLAQILRGAETVCGELWRQRLAGTVEALPAGLVACLLVHSLAFLLLLRREAERRAAALPARGPELPRTFHPSPLAEWTAGVGVIFHVGWMLALFQVFTNNFGFRGVPSLSYMIVIVSALSVVAAPFAARRAGRNVLSLRVEQDGFSFARGRGQLQWTHVSWSDVTVREKERDDEGSKKRWMEITFKSGLPGLTIHPHSLADDQWDYHRLRDMLKIEPA